MRLGVMADSHDNVPMVRKAVELFKERQVELVVHAGDFIAPFAVAPLADLSCPVLAVFGNNDGERLGLQKVFASFGAAVHPNLAQTTVAERTLAAVHYPELAEPLADSGHFDVVIYGHTHQIDVRSTSGLLLNPGEVGGWVTGRSTVAIVELESLAVEICDLGVD